MAVLSVTLSGMVPAAADKASGGGKDAVEAVPFSHIPADIRQKMHDQEPLKKAASKISWAVEKSGREHSGLAGIALQPKSVEVWWKGKLPAAVSKALGQARGIAPVEVKPARYSQAELKAAAAGLIADMEKDPEYPITQVAGSLRGDGLVLTTKDKTKALAAQAKTISGVPVSYVDGGVPSLDGRYNDSPPYKGGGAILNDDNQRRCTAGWGVIDVYGNSFLLTAGHCGRPGGGWHNGEWSGGGTGEWIGTASREHVGHDLLLINADSQGRIWDGSSWGDFTKRVAGWDWAYANEWICQSGSTSGAVCGIQNTDNFTYAGWWDDLYGNYEFYYDLVVARRTNGGLPSQGGDSGGPVFAVSGSGDVVAKGTVTAHDGSTMYYQDFGTAWRDFGINVKIG
ncbi:S1 family peptidase [Spirillospora sp. NPDC052269]